MGIFAVDAGQDYAVSLSDNANGTVVADALYIVKVEELTDAVTWAPALPAGGSYQVYAKWTSDGIPPVSAAAWDGDGTSFS